MSKLWLNVVKDSNLVENPFLPKVDGYTEINRGGKGFFLNSDNYRNVLLGGGSTYKAVYGGQSYPPYYYPILYPPYHQPRRKMLYD